MVDGGADEDEESTSDDNQKEAEAGSSLHQLLNLSGLVLLGGFAAQCSNPVEKAENGEEPSDTDQNWRLRPDEVKSLDTDEHLSDAQEHSPASD